MNNTFTVVKNVILNYCLVNPKISIFYSLTVKIHKDLDIFGHIQEAVTFSSKLSCDSKRIFTSIDTTTDKFCMSLL